MGVGNNIKRLREAHHLTQEEFGKIADVSSMAVSQWENDRAVPRMGAVQKLADYFHVSKGTIIDDRPLIPDNAIKAVAGDYVAVPLRGSVHAGDPTDAQTVEDVTALIPKFLIDDDPDTYAAIAEGDCMNRVYPEGCVIAISPNKEPQNGSVAVVTIDGVDTVMRRMYRTSHTLVLSPDSFNEEHEDIVICQGDGHTVEFGGKVVWFQSKSEME